jgi:hypothetical protein
MDHPNVFDRIFICGIRQPPDGAAKRGICVSSPFYWWYEGTIGGGESG